MTLCRQLQGRKSFYLSFQKAPLGRSFFFFLEQTPAFLEEVCSWQVLFPDAPHCNSNPSNLISFWHYQIGERSTSAWGSRCRGEWLLHGSQQVLTSQWLISIFMSELHVETYRIAQETDVGDVKSPSSQNIWILVFTWHLSHISWDGLDFNYFSWSSILKMCFFFSFISGSPTSVYIRIIWGCLLKMKTPMPFCDSDSKDLR